MSVLHVNHIVGELNKRFEGLIDLSDVAGRPDEKQYFLTRALSAFVIAELCKVDEAVAAKAVVDGSEDNGIDAFYYNQADHLCYVAQSKFSRAARGGLEAGDVHKFVQGLRDLLNCTLTGKLAAKRPDVELALGDSHAKFVLVIACTGLQCLSPHSEKPLDALIKELNDDYGDSVSKMILDQRALHEIVARQAFEAIDLNIMLHEFGFIREPYKAYYGQLDVSDIAAWAKYGDDLFQKNIRGFKGSTVVNDGMADTLKKNAAHFWYFNNGITILCSSLTKQPLGGAKRDSGVFECKGVSVVNGAQTVGSILAALRSGTEQVHDARVLVRLISLEKCPEGFASDLTRAANTQNRIERRDFASLDPQQPRLRTELLLSHGKEYVYRTGEQVTAPESGCTLDEASIALACAMDDVSLCVQAKREVGKLYEDLEAAPYRLLFNSSLSALKMWNCVEVLRVVDAALKDKTADLVGRDKLVAIHGNRLVLHVVFWESRALIQGLDTPISEEAKRQIGVATVGTLRRLIGAVGDLYPSSYPSNLFKNATKCKGLVDSLMRTDVEGITGQGKLDLYVS